MGSRNLDEDVIARSSSIILKGLTLMYFCHASSKLVCIQKIGWFRHRRHLSLLRAALVSIVPRRFEFCLVNRDNLSADDNGGQLRKAF